MKKIKPIRIKEAEVSYKPFFQEMYAVAYVITGNERQAEEALIGSIMDFPYPNEDDYKNVYSNVRDRALKLASPENGEYFAHSGASGEDDGPVTEYLLSLPETQLRCALLRYAIALPVHEISDITGEKASKIKEILSECERRSSKSARGGSGVVRMLKKSAWDCVISACYAPDFSALFRAVEARSNGSEQQSVYARSIKGILSWMFTLTFLIIAALIIWMGVVLVDYYRETYIQPQQHEIQTQTGCTEDLQCPF